MKKNFTLLGIRLSILSVLFLGLGSLQAQDGLTLIGNECMEPSFVFGQPNINSLVLDSDPNYRSAGQSFTVPNGVSEIETIVTFYSSIEPGTYTLYLYSGTPSSGNPIGTPIASTFVTVASQLSGDIEAYFTFNSPVPVSAGGYYFLVDPSNDTGQSPASRYRYRIENPGTYADGAALSGLTNGNLAVWNGSLNYDLAFEVVTCGGNDEPAAPLPAMPRYLLIGLALGTLGLGVLIIRKF